VSKYVRVQRILSVQKASKFHLDIHIEPLETWTKGALASNPMY
jgi:hypothetical protein